MTDDTKSLYLVAAAPSEDHRIEQLINVGADPNWRNPEDGGKTPLHNAILHTNKMGALYLLEGGADPSIVDNHLSTPLHIAAQMGDDFVTNVLLDMSHVDSLSLPDQDGNHPLHYAAQLSTCLVLTALINNAVYIDPVNSLTRETPLHVAARNDRVEAVEHLLRSGANPNTYNIDHQRPIDIAVGEEVRQILQAHIRSLHNTNTTTTATAADPPTRNSSNDTGHRSSTEQGGAEEIEMETKTGAVPSLSLSTLSSSSSRQHHQQQQQQQQQHQHQQQPSSSPSQQYRPSLSGPDMSVWKEDFADLGSAMKEFFKAGPSFRIQLHHPYAYIAGGIATFVVLLTTLVLVLTSINRVEYDEYGILYDRVTRDAELDRAYGPGRYWKIISQRFIMLPRFWTTITFGSNPFLIDASRFDVATDRIRGRTQDGLTVRFDLSVQYQLQNGNVTDLFREYGHGWQYVMTRTVETAVLDVVSDFDAQDLFSLRTEVSAALETELQQRLPSMYAELQNLQLGQIELIGEYDEAIEDKVIAQYDIFKAELDRDVDLIYTDIDLYDAHTNASITRVNANANATITRFRADLYANLTQYEQQTLGDGYADIIRELRLPADDLLHYIWLDTLSRSVPDGAALFYNLGRFQDVEIKHA